MPKSEISNDKNSFMRKMPPRSENFSVIGLKIDESDDFFTISLYFNDAVNANSIKAEHIFINNLPISPETEFLFNKNRHMSRFTVSKKETLSDFSIRITNLCSFDGKIMNPIELNNLETKTFYKFSREKHEWQKSSL